MGGKTQKKNEFTPKSMISYIVDTTVLIEHLRQNATATDFLKKYNPGFSTVSKAELIAGVKNKNMLQSIIKLCSVFPENKINEKIADSAIKLMERHYLSHHLLFLDALIAATAIEENLTLVTDNFKHFSFISNLKLQNWKEIKNETPRI